MHIPMWHDDPSYTIAIVTKADKAKHPECKLLNAEEHHKYREYVGKLMYLMVCTRPDIAFTVNFLARFCGASEKRHMYLLMKLVRYLKYTRNMGIFYPATKLGEKPKFDLVGYVDAAFEDCVNTRKSTSGYLFCINGSPMTWGSSRQTVVTTSSTEAEYVAASDGAKEAIWIR